MAFRKCNVGDISLTNKRFFQYELLPRLFTNTTMCSLTDRWKVRNNVEIYIFSSLSGRLSDAWEKLGGMGGWKGNVYRQIRLSFRKDKANLCKLSRVCTPTTLPLADRPICGKARMRGGKKDPRKGGGRMRALCPFKMIYWLFILKLFCWENYLLQRCWSREYLNMYNRAFLLFFSSPS